MKAVILAAGKGTRLRPLTNYTAKPAVWFFNRPVIWYTLISLYDSGIRQVLINLHHLPETVRKNLAELIPSDMQVHFFHETEILGTAGALVPMRKHLGDAPFFLINGDILTDIDFNKMIDHHNSRNALATLALHPASIALGFPLLGATADGRLSRFPYGPAKEAPYEWAGIFTGIQILEPGVFDFLKPEGFQAITNIYAEYFEKKLPVAAFYHQGYWNDIGTVERYVQAHFDVFESRIQSKYFSRAGILNIEDRQFISKSTHASDSRSLGKNVITNGTVDISRNVFLENVIVWPGNRFDSPGTIRNRIVLHSGDSVSASFPDAGV